MRTATTRGWEEAGRARAPGLAGIAPAWGITVVRLMMGIILIEAGLSKWVHGIAGTVGYFGQIGIPAPGVLGPWVGAQELIGGILVLLGFKVRWVAILFVVEFLVTTFYVKVFNPKIGFEAARPDLMLLAAALMLIVAGAGKLALDEWLARVP